MRASRRLALLRGWLLCSRLAGGRCASRCTSRRAGRSASRRASSGRCLLGRSLRAGLRSRLRGDLRSNLRSNLRSSLSAGLRCRLHCSNARASRCLLRGPSRSLRRSLLHCLNCLSHNSLSLKIRPNHFEHNSACASSSDLLTVIFAFYPKKPVFDAELLHEITKFVDLEWVSDIKRDGNGAQSHNSACTLKLSETRILMLNFASAVAFRETQK